MRVGSTATGLFRGASNRFGLDYRSEAALLGAPCVPIIDAHLHVNGARAAALLRDCCALYGIERLHSMTHLEQLDSIRAVFGDRIDFIAVPNFADPDRLRAHTAGYLDRIRAFHREGVRTVKFWAAPRATDIAIEAGSPGALALGAAARVDAADLAASLGMRFMVHCADPDAWFATRYRDASTYGTKRSHYEPLEAMLDRWRVPTLVAHMGGWPEDLVFLDGLLARHTNLWLDTSATKWMVRELSRHPRDELIAFLDRHQARIMFGSDTVTSDDHLVAMDGKSEMASKANDEREAFELYTSRYWTLRTFWETTWNGPSPISDPDLAMVDPIRHGPLDAPGFQGLGLDRERLSWLYRDAARAFLAA
ncbi:MAG: hypothetical protein FJ270_05530 [Planctomycetes bacterium]|nr:hypothetical protein [Planctomycetota bacterium]